MLGNIYKQNTKRMRVEKQIAFDYYTCKEWFKGKVRIISMTKNQIENLEYVCTL